jgi:RNA polymerase sigma-70 factor (ECF subfamily)
MQALLKGEREAGEWFVREHYPRIYRMLLHFTHNPDLASDLAQQTFVNAWKAMATFRNESQLRTWLHRIAWNAFLHWKRAQKDLTTLESIELLPDTYTSNRIEAIRLEQALTQIEPEQRVTFILFHVQEFSVREVADTLGIPEGTVKSRLHATRQRLRNILNGQEQEEALLFAQESSALLAVKQEGTPHEVSTHLH